VGIATPEDLLLGELEVHHEASLVGIGRGDLAERHGVEGDPHSWDDDGSHRVLEPSPVADFVRLIEAPEAHSRGLGARAVDPYHRKGGLVESCHNGELLSAR